jgi:hypothetical protein
MILEIVGGVVRMTTVRAGFTRELIHNKNRPDHESQPVASIINFES